MRRLQRFSLRPIFSYYLAASEDDPRERSKKEKKRTRNAERCFRYGLPTLAFLAILAFQVVLSGGTELLAATSLLIGGMLSVFIFLANLRIKIDEDPDKQVRTDLKKVVGYSAVGSLYVCTIAVALSIALVIYASFPGLLNGTWFSGLPSAVIGWLAVHLFISLAIVMRQILNIFMQLFGADFPRDK